MKLDIWGDEIKPKYFLRLRERTDCEGVFLVIADRNGETVDDGHILLIEDGEIRMCTCFNVEVAKKVNLLLNSEGCVKIGSVF